MISFLSSWVKNLSLALVIISILEMILPNNKTKKYVKMIMGLYILFSIISPFIENQDSIDLNNINMEFYTENVVETSSDVDQTSMDKRLREIYVEELEKDITQKIENRGYVVENCTVDAYISENEDDTGISKIKLEINKKEDENTQEKNTIEDKIVTEIRKIQKVNIGDTDNSENQNEDDSNITKTDIATIKKFLVEEYGVSEECLKIN